MTGLSDLATPTPTVDGRYAIEVPAGWRQGRGSYGGLTIAGLVRAIEHAVGDPTRTVRSVTAELPGPVMAGPAEITTEILRTGKSVSTARAALAQAGEIKAHAVCVLAATRRGHGPLAWQELVLPEAPPWSQVEPLVMIEANAARWPEFVPNFEYRVVD